MQISRFSPFGSLKFSLTVQNKQNDIAGEKNKKKKQKLKPTDE